MPAPDVAADLALEEEAAGEAVVVATILRNADGSYTLETGAGPAMMDPAMGAPEGDAGMSAGGAGQSFGPDQVGELMTAVHELIDPDTEGGAQSKANFDEGFGAAPPAPAPVA